MVKFSNWNNSVESEPSKVKAAHNLNELVAIVRDQATYPSPIRVAGHLHSMTACFATTGTQVFLEGEFDSKCELSQDQETLTVGAGVSMLAIARFLHPKGRQLAVMPEIGNATAGSVACCGTKDSSFNAGAFVCDDTQGPLLKVGPAQVSSTVIAIKMVKADGTIESVDERNGAADTARMRILRSSYGLFGIIYEVTFKTEPLTVARYTYEEFALADPLPTLDDLRGKTADQPGANAILGFVDPYSQRILVEQRTLVSNSVGFLDRGRIDIRKFIWKYAASELASLSSALGVSSGPLHNRLVGLTFHELLGGFDASRPDCVIDFHRGGPYFEFTFWAFPVSKWNTLVPAYLDFARAYKDETGFQQSLFTEIYHISKDDRSFLSFSPNEIAFTLDMVHHDAADPLWQEMNRRFNVFAVEHGGIPLLNQTKELTTSPTIAGKSIVQTALGTRWQEFLTMVKTEDPGERFLNAFFKSL